MKQNLTRKDAIKIPLRVALFYFFLSVVCLAGAQPPVPAPANPPGPAPPWIARSNKNTQLVLKFTAKYFPERAGRLGVQGLDAEILQLPPDRQEKMRSEENALRQTLTRRLTTEKDALVAQDLQILRRTVEQDLRGLDLSEKYDLPYYNVAQIVFNGLRALLDDQVPQNRRRAALVRLRKYAGAVGGYAPLTLQAKARTADWSRPGQQSPSKIQMESDLARANFFIDGIPPLFEKYKIQGYAEPFARLKQQIKEYNAWLTQEILPGARADFRLPPEKYAFLLQQYGIDIPQDQLTAMAHAAFTEYQQEMAPIAQQIARDRGYSASDYRSVIRELKKDQLVGDAILPHYKQRLQDIEAIIRREHLVTLPGRPARIRLATPAETAGNPAPNMVAPPLVNNTGQQGEFVLPLNVPAAPGSAATRRVDDFTFAAGSWTLTAHEARPGHEVQYDSMVERGVSLARSIYAHNSVNSEGWGLYSEYLIKPFMPLDGQLISLQLRLLRAARAFIDPELQNGTLTPEEAMRILTRDVVLSPQFANTEVERYTFRSPGQATSYFYGYTRLLALRKDVEARQGKDFDQQKFHDFVLGQGLLPPDLMRKTVMQDFVAAGK